MSDGVVAEAAARIGSARYGVRPGACIGALDGVNNFGNKAEYSQRPRTGTYARNKNNEEKVGRERGAAAVG